MHSSKRSGFRAMALMAFVAVVMLATTTDALALTNNSADFQKPFINLIESILNVFNGGLARMLAILAIIGLGLSAMVGRLSWGLAVRVVLGIVLVFGAAAIVGLITGTAGDTGFKNNATSTPAAGG